MSQSSLDVSAIIYLSTGGCQHVCFLFFFSSLLYLGHYSFKRLEGSPLQLTSWGQIWHLKGLRLGWEHPKIDINLQNMIWFHNIDEICRLLLWAQQSADEASPEWVNPSLTWPFHLFTLQEQLKVILVRICQMAETSAVFLQFPIAKVVDP